eukprot:TRINITY_DN2223_c0_g6_i1.p2 TRINITY_DN2223_c0_g6~~TRINITY_DN2223_c0_g6_i1.p2  ORF type:complete len:109 (+),score=12.75 TRINITY_DN2223_c0_g6_i1:139-465(+)
MSGAGESPCTPGMTPLSTPSYQRYNDGSGRELVNPMSLELMTDSNEGDHSSQNLHPGSVASPMLPASPAVPNMPPPGMMPIAPIASIYGSGEDVPLPQQAKPIPGRAQ